MSQTPQAVTDNTQADPNELNWQDVNNLGIEPAPAGLTEDDHI